MSTTTDLPQAPRVALILLNYRGADNTLGCLASLQALAYPDVVPIVVDNDSQDDSVERIRAAHPQIRLLVSPQNTGYAGGNNLGIQEALRDPAVQFVWLLNNDTTVTPETLTRLVQRAQQHPRALIGSLMLYPDGRFQTVGNRVDPRRWRTRGYKFKTLKDGQTVDTLCGCSMLIPREVFAQIGLLDEAYFLYLEDTDFCLRAKAAGFPSVVALQSIVYHQDGASTRTRKHWREYYAQRNRLIIAKKFATPYHYGALVVYNVVYRQARSFLKALLKNTPEAWRYHGALILALRDYFRGVRGQCPHTL